MNPIQRIRIVLGFDRSNYPLLLLRAQAVHDGISAATALFPSPTPTMAVFAGQILDLRSAQQALAGKTGTTTARNAKAAVVVGSLENLEMYVQNQSDAQPDQAAVIAEAAAMKVAATAQHHKPELAAVNGVAPGSARLAVNRSVLAGPSARTAYINWQYSLDGKTWTSTVATLRAKTEIDGLPSLTVVSFRASATSSSGVQTSWSQVVTLLIK